MQSDPADDVEARLRREAEFHDQRFAENTRAPTDAYYGVAGRAFERYAELVLGDVAGRRVLEYGCGSGPGSQAFDLAARGARVDGIDISPVAVELVTKAAAERGVGDRCHFEVMSAEATTYPTGSFDRVVGSGILHHLDLDRSFAEISRILKPGGRAIFLEPLGHNPAINWYRRRTPEMRTDDEHPLLARDVATASRHFSRVTPDFFHCLVLAAVPLRRVPYVGVMQRVLDRLDGVLLSRRSPLRWAAWMVVLTLEK